MPLKVMIVEDEMLVACHMETIIEDLGFCPVGIAADAEEARCLADAAPDIALVDLNLRDGKTGHQIGAYLGDRGISVVFITANPGDVRPPIPGALGVLPKPCNDQCIEGALRYASSSRIGRVLPPPVDMQLF